MVDQIEDPIFTGLCESIRNWDIPKKTFLDAAATLWGHEISKNTDQTKKAIEIEVNGLPWVIVLARGGQLARPRP